MRKSIFTAQYEMFLELLRESREAAGITQVEMARRLRTTQSTISKCERGERRIDVVELRRWCRAMGRSLADFTAELDRILGG